jgi:O-methyltransferase involved in polyketide biosynthesis
MHLMMLSVDLFTEAFAQAFEVFDPKRLVVISEGLINYFEKTY